MLRQWGLGAVCAGAMALLAAAPADARHPREFDELVRAADRLHCAMQDFDRVACCRPIHAGDRQYLKLAVRQSCSLLEAARCGAYGRAVSDHAVLRMYLSIIDRRLEGDCDLHDDPELMRSWANVSRKFRDVTCALEHPVLAHPRSRHGYHDDHDGHYDHRQHRSYGYPGASPYGIPNYGRPGCDPGTGYCPPDQFGYRGQGTSIQLGNERFRVRIGF
jgi:hypothetical protein